MQKEKLLEALLADYPKASQVAAFFKQLLSAVQETRRDLTQKIDAKLAAIRQPEDGHTPTAQELTKLIKPLIPAPVKGDNGHTPTTQELVAIIEPLIPDPIPGEPGRNGKDVDPATIEAMEEQLEDFEKRLNATKPGTGIFIGPSRGIFLYIDGVKKGLINNANLKAGVGVSLAYSKVNGQDTITINASGGGTSGVTVETPAGAVDASNTVFTVSAEPKWVVADGTTYYDGAGYTYAALTVTMDVPPSASIRAIM
jgi:hypothetical protein